MTVKQPPTDQDILAAISSHGSLTAYIASVIGHRRQRTVPTAWVLRQLKRMERGGKVRRVSSSYRTQICWAVGA